MIWVLELVLEVTERNWNWSWGYGEREREREREVLEAFGVTERKKSWLWVKKKRRPLGGGK